MVKLFHEIFPRKPVREVAIHLEFIEVEGGKVARFFVHQDGELMETADFSPDLTVGEARDIAASYMVVAFDE